MAGCFDTSKIWSFHFARSMVHGYSLAEATDQGGAEIAEKKVVVGKDRFLRSRQGCPA